MVKTITTSQGEFVFLINVKEATEFILDHNGDFIGLEYCSEIIKDDELAKLIVNQSIHSDLYSDYIGCIKMYSKSFASLLQANDINLDVQDWFVVKKM